MDRQSFEQALKTGLLNDAPQPLETISARELQRKEIPPMRFVVNGLIPAGLNILASPPKYGKSWLVLDLGMSVASGRKFLGYTTNRCACLYLALEDSQRRLKSRMNKLLCSSPAPDGFYFATAAKPLDDGLLDELEAFLDAHRDTGLIIIDTLQRVRGAAHGREGAYAADYREVGALKAFADRHNVALLLVHHLRKMKDDGDPFNMISGTNGISGAADTMIVLSKEKRADSNATMSVVGRDVESCDMVLTFDSESCRWVNLGDADAFAEEQKRKDYMSSPIVVTVKKLLEQKPQGWTGTAQDLLDAGRYIARTQLASTARELSGKLRAMTDLLLEYDGIACTRRSNGSGGGKYSFVYTGVQFEELGEAENNPFLTG